MAQIGNSTPRRGNAGTNKQNPVAERSGDDLVAEFVVQLQQRHLAGQLGWQTVRSYQGEAVRFREWCRRKKVPLATATVSQLRAYATDLQRRCTPRTIETKLAIVRRLYTQVVCGPGRRPDNPAADLTALYEAPPSPPPPARFTPTERRRMLEAPCLETPVESKRRKAIRDRAILGLIIEHGLRVAELVVLQVADVDLERGELRVRGRRGAPVLTLVPLAGVRLDAWLELRPALAKPDETALFVATRPGGRTRQPRGTAMSGRAIRDMVDRYLRALELKQPGVSAESLRGTANGVGRDE